MNVRGCLYTRESMSVSHHVLVLPFSLSLFRFHRLSARFDFKYLPVLLRSIVLGSYHHLDRFEGLPVVGGVVLRRHVVPRSPEDPVPDALVPLVIVLPVEVGRHAGIEPPAGAVVGTAVSRRVHVMVAIGCREEFLVMVEVLVETDSIPSRATVSTDRKPVA